MEVQEDHMEVEKEFVNNKNYEFLVNETQTVKKKK